MSTIECSGLDWFRSKKTALSTLSLDGTILCYKFDQWDVFKTRRHWCAKNHANWLWRFGVKQWPRFWQNLYTSGYFALPYKFNLVDRVVKPRQKPWKCHWLQSSSSQVLIVTATEKIVRPGTLNPLDISATPSIAKYKGSFDAAVGWLVRWDLSALLHISPCYGDKTILKKLHSNEGKFQVG